MPFLRNIFRPRPSSRFINLNRAIIGVDLWISESDLPKMLEVKRALDRQMSAKVTPAGREEFKRQWNQLVEGMRI